MLSLLALAACGGGHDSPCGIGFLGDPSKPPTLTAIVQNPDGTVFELHDGDRVPMIQPQQGGRVVFVGVRVTNMDSCGVLLSGSIRDTATRQVRFDNRTINLTRLDDAGVGGTVITQQADYSNIPLCPNQWSSTDVFGASYELTVTVTDTQKRTATATYQVKPYCSQPGDLLSECMCTCRHGYILGQSCDAADGGADGAP